ncbi:MAG: NAD(P)-dependent oxidoreductase [Propionibacteriaceae bacterium]
MSQPVVLNLSPSSVLSPVYDQLADTLPPHRLIDVPERDQSALLAAVTEADVIMGDWTAELKLTADVLRAAVRCRVVVQPTAGFDSIDVTEAKALGLPVVNTPGANARGVAEWAVMAMLATLKNLLVNHDRTKRGEWWMTEAADEGVYDLGDRVVGILGFGEIGRGVARRVHAFGVKEILYLDPQVDLDQLDDRIAVRKVTEIDTLFADSDIVSVHLPLTPGTRHLVDAEKLALLGEHGVLINTSRGAVVDEAALQEALRTRTIKAAALDVFGEEPLTGDHRWAELDNVLLSPHLAGSTVESRDKMVTQALESVAAALRGELPGTVVNNVERLR